MIDAKLGNFTLNSNKSITNTTDIRWDINDLFRITGNFNIAVSEGNGEKYISPDSKAFKDETDIAEKGRLEVGNGPLGGLGGNINGAFNKLTENNSLISMIIGAEIRKNRSRNSSLKAAGFYDDALNFIGHATGYPTDSKNKPSGDQDLSRKSASSPMLTICITIATMPKFMYTVFPVPSKFGSNQRYGQFSSGGLGWNLHNENFLKFEKLNLLKIRGSVGYTGEFNFRPFQSITMYKYENTLGTFAWYRRHSANHR